MSDILHMGEADFGNYTILTLSKGLAAHAHAEAQIVVALTPETRDIVTVNDRPLTLSYQDAIFVNPMEKHDHQLITKNGTFLVIYLHSHWLISTFSKPEPGARFFKNIVPLSGEMRELVNHFVKANADGVSAAEATLWVEQFVNHMKQLDPEQSDDEKPKAPEIHGAEAKIGAAIHYMRSHMHLHDDVETVARKIGVSRQRLFNLFRFHLNTTPNICWNALRMVYARNQLARSSDSIELLAAELGFSEPGNFSRFFRHQTGFYPSQFRTAARSRAARHGKGSHVGEAAGGPPADQN